MHLFFFCHVKATLFFWGGGDSVAAGGQFFYDRQFLFVSHNPAQETMIPSHAARSLRRSVLSRNKKCASRKHGIRISSSIYGNAEIKGKKVARGDMTWKTNKANKKWKFAKISTILLFLVLFTLGESAVNPFTLREGEKSCDLTEKTDFAAADIKN